MEDTFEVLQGQILKLLEALGKLKSDKKQLLEEKEGLNKEIAQLNKKIEDLQNENNQLHNQLRQISQGPKIDQQKVETLLAKVEEAIKGI